MKYSFPLKECKQHSFCEFPDTEDHSLMPSQDLKSYIRSVSPMKKLDLREREIVSINSMPNEFDLKYLKSIEEQMDDLNSVKPNIPIVTEEGLSDWCQQSMNRRFPVIPPTRPFLLPKAVYEYLKSVQDLNKETPVPSVPNDKELMTVAEIQSIIMKKPISIHQLQPRTMENGTPFIYPRFRNRKKVNESVSFASQEIPKPKSKSRQRAVTFFQPENKNDAKGKNEIVPKEALGEHSIYKLDSNLAKQVLEITKKRSKFFQNLAFSSVFLGKIIEKDKNINLMIPPEFRMPLIEQKDIPDFPSVIELYVRPYFKQVSQDLRTSFECLAQNKWREAADLFKAYLKTNSGSVEAQYGLAMALERLHCYKLSRKWLIEALKIEPENCHVLFGIAVICVKLNEIGNAIYFCKKTLEGHQATEPGYFYYVLSICYRLLKSVTECNSCYQSLININDNKISIYSSFHTTDWDEQVKSLPNWMQNRVDIPFFRRFKPKQLKTLSNNKIRKIEPQTVVLLQPGTSYVVIKGALRLRDHSRDCTRPKSIWKVHTGQYINYNSHKAFYEELNFWMFSEANTFLLEIPSEVFITLSRESRTNKEIVNMHLLQSFPIFQHITLETLEALVLESMKIKKCHKGQIVRKKLTDRKIDKKSLFGVIITGICDLKREDGLDLAIVGRGDCFGEEFVFKELSGLASVGNLVVRTENLEVGFISPQDLLRLPDYELHKIEESLKKNPHIKRCVEKANSAFNLHARWQSVN